MRGQELLQRANLRLCRTIEGEAEEDDSGVRVVITKHQLAEVFVVGDQEPLLSAGEGEDLLVGENGGVVAADTRGLRARF